MSFEIREMAVADYDDVYGLWQECPGVGLSDSDTRDGVARFLDANPGLSFVATDGGHLVGAVLCGHDGRRGYITHLAVAPGARGWGLGRQLVEHCLVALRRERVDKCHLFVFADNTDARSFWRSVGWTERTDLRVLSRFTEDGGSDP